MERALGGKEFVRTALNNRGVGRYCAIAHASSAVATECRELVHPDVSCSPLTHASKEPESLLAPDTDAASDGGVGGGGGGVHGSRGGSRGGRDGVSVGGSGDGGRGTAHFGLRLGASVQDGPARGLVVTLSPGSLSGSAADEERGERKLAARAGDGVAVRPLEARWRSFWDGARGRSGAQDLAEVVPWTSGSSSVALDASGVSRGGGEGRRRSLVAEEGGARLGPVSRAREYHGGKAKGYVSALEHLGGRMEEEGGRALSEACGWDRNLEFVHAGDDLVYLK